MIGETAYFQGFVRETFVKGFIDGYKRNIFALIFKDIVQSFFVVFRCHSDINGIPSIQEMMHRFAQQFEIFMIKGLRRSMESKEASGIPDISDMLESNRMCLKGFIAERNSFFEMRSAFTKSTSCGSMCNSSSLMDSIRLVIH